MTMSLAEIKEEVGRSKCEYSRSVKGTEERLTRGKEFIRALNLAIGTIEDYLQCVVAVILDEDARRTQGEVETGLREYLEWARGQKLEVRKEVGPQLIDSWLADESGYDEAAWPVVQQDLDGNRTPQKGRSGE